MPWVKVPAEHHPLFRAALPKDSRVDTRPMFGGLASMVNGNVFAGLFARSVMIWLPEDQRAEALALEGAAPFEPMGNGRVSRDKIMLPEAFMDDADELRAWILRAFRAAAELPVKLKGAKKAAALKEVAQAPKKSAAKTRVAKPPKKSAAKTRVARPPKAVGSAKRSPAN